jgi:hypothetical protein
MAPCAMEVVRVAETPLEVCFFKWCQTTPQPPAAATSPPYPRKGVNSTSFTAETSLACAVCFHLEKHMLRCLQKRRKIH